MGARSSIADDYWKTMRTEAWLGADGLLRPPGRLLSACAESAKDHTSERIRKANWVTPESVIGDTPISGTAALKDTWVTSNR